MNIYLDFNRNAIGGTKMVATGKMREEKLYEKVDTWYGKVWFNGNKYYPIMTRKIAGKGNRKLKKVTPN